MAEIWEVAESTVDSEAIQREALGVQVMEGLLGHVRDSVSGGGVCVQALDLRLRVIVNTE